MPFHYTRPLASQNTATTLMLAGAAGLMVVPGVEPAWAQIVDKVPEWFLVAMVPTLAHLVLYWAMSLGFDYVDRNDKPDFIARYRIQSGPPRRPPWRRVLPNLALNQLVLAPLGLLGLWWLLHLRGWQISAELPSPWLLLAEVVGIGLFSVIWFYISHRFLHRPWWMKRVHKVHHEFRTTAAVSSEYAHPFEFIVANLITVSIGVAILAPSVAAIYTYTLVAMFTVVIHHSGYALPWAPWSVHHDWHHYRYKEVFGTLGYIDRLMRTDKELHTLEHGDVR